MRIGGAIRSLENFPSITTINLSEFLRFGEVDYRIFPILGLQRPPAVGEALVPLIPIRDGVEVTLILLILAPLFSLGVGKEVSLIPL